MKRWLFLLLPFLTGCTTTGDWNEDSICFSREKADHLIAKKTAVYQSTRRQTDRARSETEHLEHNVASANANRRQDASESRRLLAEITRLETECSRKEAQLASTRASVAPDAAVLRDLERQIEALELSIARNRAELAMIISVR